MKNKQNKGITLIALVITIIVLLILASVSINMVVGENGILTRTKQAVETKNLAEEKEKISFAVVGALTTESGFKEISLESLTDSISNEFGADSTTVSENPDGSYTVILKSNNHEYQLLKSGEILEIELVDDKTPGKLAGKGTENDPYLIESVEDLIVFSYNVRNGESYSGKYIKLTCNLNLASRNSYVNSERTDYDKYGYNGKLKDAVQNEGFISIGQLVFSADEIHNMENLNTIFKGDFNGNNKTISNYNINKNIEADGWCNFGLFTFNLGIIENLNVIGRVQANLNVSQFSSIGIISGGNKQGTIKNCQSGGEIIGVSKKYSYNFGGLCGANSGKVENSYNTANVNGVVIDSEIGTEVREGGILGVNETEGRIKNCYNIGEISMGNGLDNESLQAKYVIGTIVGKNNGNIENVYNIGKIEKKVVKYKKLDVGMIIGYLNTAYGSISRCYSIDDSSINNDYEVIIMSASEMKSNNFLDLLNENEANIFKVDSKNINSGFPVLFWQ